MSARLILALSLLLVACAPRATPAPPALTETPEGTPTSVRVATATPAPVPTGTSIKPTLVKQSALESPSPAAPPLPTHLSATVVRDGRELKVEGEQRSFESPDGRWTVTITTWWNLSVYANEALLRMEVADSTGTAAWRVIDEWTGYGLGMELPTVYDWSDDGRSLYFGMTACADGCPVFCHGDLRRLDLQTGHVLRLAAAVTGAQVSPDSSTLAYVVNGLVLRDTQSNQERYVALSHDGKYGAGGVVWEPHGKSVLVHVADGDDPCAPVTTLVTVDVQTLKQTTLFSDSVQSWFATSWDTDERIKLFAWQSSPQEWWFDIATGQITPAETNATP